MKNLIKKIYKEIFYISPRNRRRLKKYVKAKAKHIYNYYVIDLLSMIVGVICVWGTIVIVYIIMILLADMGI